VVGGTESAELVVLMTAGLVVAWILGVIKDETSGAVEDPGADETPGAEDEAPGTEEESMLPEDALPVAVGAWT